MRILTVCAEFAPLAKVGGLADVTAGLSTWLQRRGHDVVVVLPYYGVMHERGVRPDPRPALSQRRYSAGDAEGTYAVHPLAGPPAGARVYLVECPELFGDGVYDEGRLEAVRFVLLSRAALELAIALGFAPHVLHCHDWHAAPAAVMLRGPLRGERVFRQAYTVLTIHNIGYQGVFDDEVIDGVADSMPRALFSAADLARGQVNFLKAGIAHADALTTVSRTHANEIQTPAYGKGLDALLRQRRHRLAGILNGVDYSHWSPEADALLPERYSMDEMDGKRATRAALLDDLGLEADDVTPVIGLVSRLAEQKGIDLIMSVLPELLKERQFICAFLGSGETRYVQGLRDLARDYPSRVAFMEGQDETLAHRILAGSDMLLIPSRYEPCGLTQLYAMRYGTVPVVRKTGGLADTVAHFDPATGRGTGCVFRDADVGGLGWGLRTALDWFADRNVWRRLVRNGMSQDFSWDRQGPEYEELFRRLVGGGG
jgi:starch synthase